MLRQVNSFFHFQVSCLSHIPFRCSNQPYRYSHADFMTEMRETLRSISSNLEIFVPAVINLSAGRFNLWDGSQSNNSVAREGYFRSNLVTALCSENEKNKVKCMVTGTVDRSTIIGSDRIVLCAHIIPNSAKSAKNVEKLLNLGFDATDVDSTRNALFLVSGIEWAFDRLWLSFGRNPMDPLSNQLFLRIFDMTACGRLPLYEGSDQVVSDYNNHPLLLNGHDPFQAALCLHEFSCHMKYKDTTDSAVPVFHSSPHRAGNPNLQQIEASLDFYRRAMAAEIEDEI